MMKKIVIVVCLSVFVVGCASLRLNSSDDCQGRFTPINIEKH